MVGVHSGCESRLLGCLNVIQEVARLELFVGAVVSKLCHNGFKRICNQLFFGWILDKIDTFLRQKMDLISYRYKWVV